MTNKSDTQKKIDCLFKPYDDDSFMMDIKQRILDALKRVKTDD